MSAIVNRVREMSGDCLARRRTPFPAVAARVDASRTACSPPAATFARAAARRVPPRHLSVVQRRPADAVVEPRPAHGAVHRRIRVSRSLRKRVRARTFRDARRHRFRRRSSRVCAAPRDGQAARGSRRDDRARYGALHRARLRALGRSWRDGELVGGLYGVAIGRDVLRRIDVRARGRRIEGGARRARAAACGARRSDDRLPAGDRASRVARRAADPARRVCERILRELIHSTRPAPTGALAGDRLPTT